MGIVMYIVYTHYVYTNYIIVIVVIIFVITWTIFLLMNFYFNRNGKRQIYESQILIVAEFSYSYGIFNFNSLVDKIIIHKSFNKVTWTNDIALVKIRKKLSKNIKYFTPINLAAFDIRAGNTCIRTSLGFSDKVSLSITIV